MDSGDTNNTNAATTEDTMTKTTTTNGQRMAAKELAAHYRRQADGIRNLRNHLQASPQIDSDPMFSGPAVAHVDFDALAADGTEVDTLVELARQAVAKADALLARYGDPAFIPGLVK